MPRKVFINCGARTGADIHNFKKSKYYEKDFEIYAFECLPENLEQLKNTNATIINKAVSTQDGVAKFKLGMTTCSGSLRHDKNSYMTNESIDVQTINFSKWLKENFTKEDYIIVVMDIEGSEYDVIPLLFEDDTISYINKLYLELHDKKITAVSRESHSSLLNQVIEYFNENVFIEKLYQSEKFHEISVDSTYK